MCLGTRALTWRGRMLGGMKSFRITRDRRYCEEALILTISSVLVFLVFSTVSKVFPHSEKPTDVASSLSGILIISAANLPVSVSTRKAGFRTNPFLLFLGPTAKATTQRIESLGG